MKIKSNPVQGPTSAAGLVRYFDTSGGGIEITPEMVAWFSVFFIVAEIVILIALD
ncbi:MAG: preprotein translocase subunit Sec61beta [Candidatus Diapherotrites archaeon]|nr:preprotein translocase subunit Sec61beta [Candidatus Diapherotrites archaeon]